MSREDSTEFKKPQPPRKLWWLWSGPIGFAAGALIVFTPLYIHALEDWDLADKTTFFPREFGSTVSFYSQLWLVGGAVGALLVLLTIAVLRSFHAKHQ